MNILVVGGGTAGWITALYAKKIFSNQNITLIESDKIGILGAGESATPHIVDLFRFLSIPIPDLIKNTQSTIKNTVKFTNWSSNYNESFTHPFVYSEDSISEQMLSQKYRMYDEMPTNKNHISSIIKKETMKDYCFIEKLCDIDKLPFYYDQSTKEEIIKINNFKTLSFWSMNFDARLLADYLRKVAEQRGVKRIEGEVQNVNLDTEGYIKSITLKDNQTINADFVFDCSGFKKIIIKEIYKSEWQSYKDFLPVNKAIPFFLEKDKKIPTYVEATAMDYGWSWKIPLQHRYGAGYVFNSNEISEDKAVMEAESLYQQKINPIKIISFEAGCQKKVWVKNCLSAGLSSGFIEPLESTSIFQLVGLLRMFFSNKENISTKNEDIKNKINQVYLNDSNSIAEFISWHYVTNKQNNDFWKDLYHNTNLPDQIKYLKNISKQRPICILDFFQYSSLFAIEDFLYVFMGHGLFKDSKINYSEYVSSKDLEHYENIKRNQNLSMPYLMDNSSFLKMVNEGKIV